MNERKGCTCKGRRGERSVLVKEEEDEEKKIKRNESFHSWYSLKGLKLKKGTTISIV